MMAQTQTHRKNKFIRAIQSVPYETLISLMSCILWGFGFSGVCVLGWIIEGGLVMKEVNGGEWFEIQRKHFRLYLGCVLVLSIFQTIPLYGVGSLFLLGYVISELNYEDKLHGVIEVVRNYIIQK